MHTHARVLPDLARIKEAFESIRKDFARELAQFAQMRGFLTHSSPASPTPKKSRCISVSFPSLKYKSAELPYHSRTQREMGLCSARSKVHPTQTHLFLQATWV